MCGVTLWSVAPCLKPYMACAAAAASPGRISNELFTTGTLSYTSAGFSFSKYSPISVWSVCGEPFGV